MADHVDIHAAWKAVSFVAEPATLADHPAIQELRRVYDHVVVGEFSLVERAHWAAYRQSMQRPQWNFTSQLLDSETFASCVSPLRPPRAADPAFESLSTFHLAGEFARVLYDGGAYNRVGDVPTAERLGSQLVQALIGDRRDDVDVLYAQDAWHSWFRDIAWDKTWVVLDWTSERIHFLAATSTD